MQQENSKKKNVGHVWKITNFDRQTALFNGASMEAITWGFSEVRQMANLRKLARRDGVATFTRLPDASTRHCALFPLLRASAAQKV
jgi:hypothetical protein